MEQPIRIAHVIGKLEAAGVEAVVNNYYLNIDRNKYQFDYFIHENSTGKPDQSLIDLGARYYYIPRWRNVIGQVTKMYKIFKQNQYQIVHVHMNSLSFSALFAAKLAGVPVRICHSHNTSDIKETLRTFIKMCMKPFASLPATHLAACSRYAGEWLFGKKKVENGEVKIITNAIDRSKYQYNEEIRKNRRETYMVSYDTTVVGHVGRICKQKNQTMLLRIFAEYHKNINPKSVLWIIGNGNCNKLLKLAEDLGINDCVAFFGMRPDVNELYQAMDVLLMPSWYEGFCLAVLEAECAGLPVVASDVLCEEVIVSPDMHLLSLKVPETYWAKAVDEMSKKPRTNTIDERYEIKIAAKDLEQYYDSLLDGIKNNE